MPADTAVQHHHDSHAALLRTPVGPGTVGATVDAIVVPSFRRATALDAAFRAARDLGCRIVVACTTRANARDAALLGSRYGLVPAVIAVEGMARSPLPAFRTTEWLYGTRFQHKERRRPADTSLKRNVGLLLARMVGWERIVFLDDDIVDIDVEQLRAAAALLDDFDAVGLRNHGYPDNSVVCHAHRLTGGAQGAFIGAGALAVRADRAGSFFPDVYNEDWLFLADAIAAGRVTALGEMAQQKYDPFASPRRAKQEEFGDCLGEGLFWRLDEGQALDTAGERFWEEFLGHRRQFIAELYDRVLKAEGLAEPLRQRMLDSLATARDSSRLIRPARMVEFVAHWRADLETWRAYVAARAGARTVAEALAELGLENFGPVETASVAPIEARPVPAPAWWRRLVPVLTGARGMQE
ncbi:hypothetical protein [Dactylosporangium salmoneum]|uniref:Uncharacterized protein n=1 Tax=Dactylosporangium salmoneum TaxID=53361 RepID=A0ABN3GWT9_9ACTN